MIYAELFVVVDFGVFGYYGAVSLHCICLGCRRVAFAQHCGWGAVGGRTWQVAPRLVAASAAATDERSGVRPLLALDRVRSGDPIIAVEK